MKEPLKKDYDWLLPYSQLILNKKVLELGSGSGIDTARLAELCKILYVIEKDEQRAEIVRQKFPDVKISCGDFREILPLFNYKIDTVIASLSLHYFNDIDTKKILGYLLKILGESSTLIVRVNSINDIHFGSLGYSKIEDGLLNTNGMTKRFFNHEAIEKYFSPDFEIINLQEKSIDRYSKEKIIWEFVAKKKIIK